MTDSPLPDAQRVQEEVSEIAEVLSRQSGKSLSQCWAAALSLHRVRYSDTVIFEDGRTMRLSAFEEALSEAQ